MPVTVSYPGIYIEEILSNSHTITAAPTSITVFMGYTHPFKTKSQHYGEAVQIFSFTDYEREFGGLFDVDWLADDVGRAVFQFFSNGGAVAYVVALQPQFHDLGGGPTTASTTAALTLGTAPIRDRVHGSRAGRHAPSVDGVDHPARAQSTAPSPPSPV